MCVSVCEGGGEGEGERKIRRVLMWWNARGVGRRDTVEDGG